MNSEERIRYSRQIAIEGFGVEAQERLLSSAVAIVGCGALGSMVAMQLAGSGVGTLLLCDYDTVDVSNLQRQFFYGTQDCGKSKSQILSERVRSLNPNVYVDRYDSLIDEKKALICFGDVDFVVDATDNPASKGMVEKVCRKLNKPCCIAGVSGLHGQVMTIFPGQTMMSEIFEGDENAGVLSCSASGVLGPAAALCASIQASEVIKCISGVGDVLQGKIMTFDLASNHFKVFSL